MTYINVAHDKEKIITETIRVSSPNFFINIEWENGIFNNAIIHNDQDSHRDPVVLYVNSKNRDLLIDLRDVLSKTIELMNQYTEVQE